MFRIPSVIPGQSEYLSATAVAAIYQTRLWEAFERRSRENPEWAKQFRKRQLEHFQRQEFILYFPWPDNVTAMFQEALYNALLEQGANVLLPTREEAEADGFKSIKPGKMTIACTCSFSENQYEYDISVASIDGPKPFGYWYKISRGCQDLHTEAERLVSEIVFALLLPKELLQEGQ